MRGFHLFLDPTTETIQTSEALNNWNETQTKSKLNYIPWPTVFFGIPYSPFPVLYRYS